MNDNPSRLLNSSREYVATTFSGYLMILLLPVVLVIAGFFAISGIRAGVFVIGAAAVIVVTIAKGFYVLQPNEAAAILLFGSYKGTDRSTGLRWIWPWMGKKKIS